DAARRLVDDAVEGDVVARVEQQSQVGEHVAVLLAVEEREAADDLERDVVLDERLLQPAGQGVDADEDGVIAEAALAGLHRVADAAGDGLGLVEAGVEGEEGDLLAGGVLGEEVLGLALEVVGDEAAGGGEDGLGAAVVEGEGEGAGLGVVLLEIKDISDIT